MHYELRIPGAHNQLNAQFVMEIARSVFGCGEQEVRKALSEFGGLPHRLEYCGCVDGVDYYDDSISTIPEAAIRAVNSVANAGTLLAGGMDRGIDYDILIDFIRKHPDIQFILAAFPMNERLVFNRTYAGYRGSLTFTEDLYDNL